MFEVVERSHRLRGRVETYIRDVFHHEYDARLGDLPRCLVAETNGVKIGCAASLRFAADGFLSESYLQQPIERVIARLSGDEVPRETIAEIGSLAAASPEALDRLITDLPAFLRVHEVHWACFTATARLRLFLRHAGVAMTELCPADPARIEAAELWGTYYRQSPKVMLVCAAGAIG